MKTPNYDQTTEPPAMTPGDIYFILFRHKWKIILLSLAGIAAAGAYWWFCPPPYQSEARLFIRYVLDNHSVNADGKNAQMTSPDEMGQSIINSEIEILTSFDLAEEAAKNIGPDKILAQYGGGNDPLKAAEIVRKNLLVEAPKQDSVIHVVYMDADPAIVQPVLSEIISDYLDKHLQVHQSSMSDDYLSQETAQLRSQIDETEDELRAAKTGAGIISLPDAERSYTDQIGWVNNQLIQAEVDLAAETSALKAEPEQTNADEAPTPGVLITVPEGRIEEYQRVCARLDYLQTQQNQYYTQMGYTDENRLVQETQLEIAKTKWLKTSLEQRYPDLVGTYEPSQEPGQPAGQPGTDQRLIPIALRAKISVLRQQLAELQAEAVKVDEAESKIADLERRKEMLEGNYQNFAASLEQSRIDETLGPGRVSNINTVESPTPPYKDMKKPIKAMAMMAGGGILAGLAWAFFIEFYLDTSVRRTKEIESRLKLPLLISIPDISRNGHRRLIQAAERRQLQFQNPDAEADGNSGILSWETSSCLNPFYDALRDKLVNYFENAKTIIQPKLITVTGTEKGCGVSAIAAGVATSLAETGERVLLVDMKLEHGVAQQFFLGRPCCGLDEALALETRDSALVQENLYVVTAGSPDERFQRILPRLFVSLLPRIRASDYGYIIFDMPPVSQTSITSRLAGFMDMVLLVIQSEKTHLDAVQQAIGLLAHSKTKIGVVLNKTRRYIPERLHRETLTDF
ncbi:MAG TPA: Wzz/FepE/Etk N-terminal domain-containing protein [Candidatus Sulfotelmatobacter sp.]|nr:Wzz/FepE/Etk N-terminal domain-containing protein [Candidatus Sulfotelmatobacter sp.]